MKAVAANALLENVSMISSRNQGLHFTWNLDSLLFPCGDNNILCWFDMFLHFPQSTKASECKESTK